ncbi:MAG: transcription termination factor NusA [Kiritimatiellae bacterium]|jgi:N utilization substance protein A|nr:transcription termination factor NusA [Kiritimatiellia bacterium]MDD4342018.1 transcription termination factor NusA [Kiritimatiellia bacterium]MDY0149995.1 transcription termination factor NusA [Kiritimatiellia bacterium]
MNNELLAVFEYMERERKLDRETLAQLVESALQVAGRKSIGRVRDLRVELDRKTLDIRAFASLEVVDFVRNRQEEISVTEAQVQYPDKNYAVGDLIEIEVTPRNFGRIAAQTAKQAIIQKLRIAEKDKVFAIYKDHVGDIVTGTVIRFDRNDVIVDLGDAEAVMPSSERVPSEDYQVGDRIRFLLLNIDAMSQGSPLILTRANPEFIRKLFILEVSEIADGTVEIKGIAREAGFRTKIAVHSNDDKVDPVGACVGLRGQRVKNIVRELSGEKVDIVKWNTDITTFVTNSLAPAKLLRLEVEELENTVRVIVETDQLSLAIGKKGQNARLTAKLTGWKIDIQKDEADITFEERIALATGHLAAIEGIGPDHAERLVAAGFITLEGILAADPADLVDVEGFDADSAQAVRAAAEVAFESLNGKADDE